MVKELKKFGPISFLVSFQFPNANLYKKYCRTDGFHQTVKGIENLLKYNCNFTINTVVMKPNLPHLEKMIKFLKKIGVKRYQYRFIDGKNVTNKYKEFVPRYSECTPFLKKIVNRNPDIRIFLREFPVCVLGEEFKNYLAPCFWGRLNLTAQDKILTTEEIVAERFIFPNCKRCLWKPNCYGVKKEYVNIYGAREFKPIIGWKE
jgi:sulfatase maturation enzyme AslB (radical SAM superfamily)